MGKKYLRLLPKPATNNEWGVDCWRSMRRRERKYTAHHQKTWVFLTYFGDGFVWFPYFVFFSSLCLSDARWKSDSLEIEIEGDKNVSLPLWA